MTDYRLNPLLRKSCRQDIPKFCKEELKAQTDSHTLEGKVLGCLKYQFRKHVSSFALCCRVRMDALDLLRDTTPYHTSREHTS